MAQETVDLADLGRWLEQELLAPADITDFRPALRRMRLELLAKTADNFRGAHAPDGTPWPAIQGIRARLKGTPQPLRDRGLLAASLSAKGGEGTVDTLAATSLEWGTALDYAATHQEGATIYPKEAKALAVPLTPEAYRAGGPRNFGRPLRLVWPKGKARGWLVEDRRKRGKKGERAEMQFLLLPKATIPARPFLGLTDALVGRLETVLLDFVEERLGG